LQKSLFENLCLLISIGTTDYSLDRGTWSIGLTEGFSYEFIFLVPVADRTRFVTLYLLEIVVFSKIFESLRVGDFVFKGKFIDLSIVLGLIFNDRLRVVVPA
jgi:hypothetical protein